MRASSTIESTTTPSRADLNPCVFEVGDDFFESPVVRPELNLDRSPFGPELSIPNNTEYRARAGDSLELPCGISSVSLNARLSWWKNGMELADLAEQVYGHSLILQLSSVSSNDSGHYLCRIDDDSGGRLTSHMSLKVEGKLERAVVLFLH